MQGAHYCLKAVLTGSPWVTHRATWISLKPNGWRLREIALALGVPPMLLGIPGDNTYSNYAEANRTFWRQTVLPLVNRTSSALTNWLDETYGEGIVLKPDLNNVEALASEREARWQRIAKADFLSTNEKREALGYGPVQNGEEIG